MNGLCLLVVLAAMPTRDQVEREVRARFEKTGLSVPVTDAALGRAAEALAAISLKQGPRAGSATLEVTQAISRAAGWDANPVTVAIRAAKGDLLGALAAEKNLAAEASSVFGVGLASEGDTAALVLVFALRRVELKEFARAYPRPPLPRPLCLTLERELMSADVFVTRPGGSVDRVALRKKDDGLCAEVPFPSVGRHSVEVLARGARGPEVGALFFVDVGEVPQGTTPGAGPEPATPAEARGALLVRVNALRVAQGLAAVRADPALDVIAQAYADRMVEGGFFAHVAPDGVDLTARLDAGGYAYSTAGENLGMARGPIEAHFGIEHSPGHRKNLLEPNHLTLGLGLATAGPDSMVLVEILARPVEAPTGDPLDAAYATLARARAQRGLPPLKRTAALEALALEHAREALAQALPKTALPGKRRLHDRVFEVLDSAATASVDLFVASTPTAVTESKNLIDGKNRLVGVGLVRGDSAKFGAGRYWIVVVYVSLRE